MVVQVPTPPVRYMLRLNFSIGLRFFFSIVVNYSYVTETGHNSTNFFFTQNVSVPFYLPNLSFCRRSSYKICESANITFNLNPTPLRLVFVYMWVDWGKNLILSFCWWLVFIPRAENGRQVFARGSWETQIYDISLPIRLETTLVLISQENTTSQCAALRAKSVYVLQSNIFKNTQVSTTV